MLRPVLTVGTLFVPKTKRTISTGRMIIPKNLEKIFNFQWRRQGKNWVIHVIGSDLQYHYWHEDRFFNS